MFLIRRFNPEIHHRRSIRLRGYDYNSPGAYFITICAIDRNAFFGIIENGEMILNAFGETVDDVWNDLPNHNSHIELDAFIIMPDHIHAIIIIRDIPAIVRAGSKPARAMIPPQPPTGAGYGPAPGMKPPQPKPAPGMAQPQHPVRAGSKPARAMIPPQPPPGAGSKPARAMIPPQPPPGAGHGPAPTDVGATCHALPEIIRQFKTFSARRINELRGSPRQPVWQRNYYEHIIRNDHDLNRIRAYITDNPKNTNL